MLIALLIAAAQEAGVISLPRLVTAVPPPIVMTRVEATPIRVRVAVGTRQLFNDTLRVTRNASASYSENRSEAPDVVCAGDRYYSSQDRYSLSVQLYLRDDNSNGAGVNVSVNWQRPSPNTGCDREGTRSVQLNQTVPLGPGQSITLEGDAGLTLTLSR